MLEESKDVATDRGMIAAKGIFSDIESLRISVDMIDSNSDEVLTHIPIRKPGRQEFVRVHPNPEMALATMVFVDKEERDGFFLVAPSMRAMLAGESRPVLLQLAVNRQGVLFFWPLMLPDDSGRANAWSDSAREAAERAKQKWVRVASDMLLGAYRVFVAKGEIGEPTWPDKPMNELLEIGFKGRVIDSMDNPVMRKLQGLL